MKTKATNSPTPVEQRPWKYKNGFLSNVRITGLPDSVAFIVTACNAREALVAFVARFVREAEDVSDGLELTPKGKVDLKEAKAALKAAGEE